MIISPLEQFQILLLFLFFNLFLTNAGLIIIFALVSFILFKSLILGNYKGFQVPNRLQIINENLYTIIMSTTYTNLIEVGVLPAFSDLCFKFYTFIPINLLWLAFLTFILFVLNDMLSIFKPMHINPNKDNKKRKRVRFSEDKNDGGFVGSPQPKGPEPGRDESQKGDPQKSTGKKSRSEG